MNSFLRLIPLIALFLAAAFFTPGVFAQSLNDNSYANPQPFAVYGTNNVTTSIADESPNAFSVADLRWTLPLLIVGAGMLFLRGSRERVTRRYYNPSTGYQVSYNQIRRKNRKFKKTLKAA